MRLKASIAWLTLGVIAAAFLAAPPSIAQAATGDISVGGVWVCRLTQGAPGLTLEQRVREVERRITEVLSLTDVTRRQLSVEVRPAGTGATIVAAGITIMSVSAADAAGLGVGAPELANQWAGRLVEGLRRALPGREIVGLMYTQPRGSDPREAGRVVGLTWYWRRTVVGNTQIEPRDPRRYTLQFQRNGRLGVRADCNTGFGTYVLRGSTVTISNVVTTKAGCAPGSLEGRFLASLSQASTYTVRAGILLVELRGSAGTMRFSQLLP